jgi:hypothetical protein
VVQLKRKLRQYKKLELKIRFEGRSVPDHGVLIWNEFFSTKAVDDPSVRYPLRQLLQMDHEALEEVFGEYFYRVYFQKYQEQGITPADVYDPALLSLLGLPAHAGLQDIKARFRELAKKHHPDRGGDAERFIEMMEVYERLTGGP